jgi:integrase
MRGQGRIYKRQGSSFWWLDYSVRGVRHLESSHTAKHKEAGDLLRERIGQRKGGMLVGNPEAVTFAQLRDLVERQYVLDGNRSLDRVQMALVHLEQFFGAEASAMDITPTQIDAYVEQRMAAKRPASRATCNYELSVLRRGFRLAVKKRLLSVRPEIEIPAVDNAREGFFSEGDMVALLVELPADVRDVVQFLYATGWRVSEARNLTWANVDREAETVRLSAAETKGKKGRVFPYGDAPSLKALLDARWEARNGLLVFHRHGKPIQSFRRAWANACLRTGLATKDPVTKKITVHRIVHDLRRSAARAFRRAGLSESDVMELCGWETPAMFRRYAIRDEQHLGAQVAKRFGANDTVTRQSGPAATPAPSVSSSAV